MKVAFEALQRFHVLRSGLFHLNTSVLPRNTIGGEKKFKNDLNSNRLYVYIFIYYIVSRYYKLTALIRDSRRENAECRGG